MKRLKLKAAKRAFAFVLLSFFAAAVYLWPADARAASNFWIEDYDIQVVVNEDDTYDITETISVQFTAPSHGIYRTVPLKTTLDRDGQKSSYYAKVENFRMLSGQQWKDESEGGRFMARIGDPDNYADTKTVYKMSYTYDTRGDHFKDGDEVYYNFVGKEWEAQSIDHVSFDVQFPKAIDMSKVGIKTGADTYVPFEAVSDTELKGETDEYVLRGLTIRAVLPEGYFTRQAKSASLPMYILIALLAAAAAAGLGLWRKYGKDPAIVETEEFYPPKGLSAPEVGYLDEGEIKGSHVISSLLSLADRGYLKIKEIEVPAGFRKKKTKTSYEIVKLRDYNEDIIGESTFMSGLFEDGDSVKMSELENKFYVTVGKIEKRITKRYKKKLYDETAARYSKIMIIAGIAGTLATVIITSLSGGIMRELFFEMGPAAIVLMALITVLFVVGFWGIANKINTRRGYWGIIGFALMIAGGFFFSFIFETISGTNFVPFVIGLGLCFVLFFTAALCARKTDWYADVLGKIRGYKRFLEIAEKDKMEALAEEDPEYFYKNLAFAFALGVTSVYAEHFAALATKPPEWYDSGVTGGAVFNSSNFMDSMDSMMSSVSSSMTSSPSDSGGGGGSFSGGGGGGGGGGGSW